MVERYSGGGSLALGELIDEFGGAFLRDMWFYYGIDFLEVYRSGEGVPPSIFLALFEGMPPGNACEAQASGFPGEVGYDVNSRLLMNVADWAQVTALTASRLGGGKPEKFVAEYRPWANKSEPVPRGEMSLQELHKALMHR